MESTWIRFATSEGTIIGEVKVPRRCPTWFEPIFEKMKAASRREKFEMEDISAEEWLDACCSANRPIPLARPLAPQRQEELVFFAPGKLNEMRQELDKAKAGEVNPATLLADDNWLKRFCVFMDDMDKVPLEQRGQMKPVPRKNLQPNNHLIREFTVYAPLVQQDGSVVEDKETFKLNPGRINHFVTMKKTRDFERQAEQAYHEEVPLIVAPAGAMPPAPGFSPKL